jgi:succinylglutamic semialdehyde dehydrogenase
VQGDGASGAVLAAHRDIDGVLFTGSWDVGRRILAATLDQPWKLTALEMGGKNAALVAADADLEAAARAIVFGATVTCGQRCSATGRVLVERAVAQPLCERIVALLKGLKIGYATDDDVFMGPLISRTSRERHAQVLQLAASERAVRLLDGGPFEGPRPGHYVRPSLHVVPELVRGSPYQCEEHFVPDLCLLEVESLDAGIEALNATDYGLVASVFSRDRESFERVRREARVGLLNWNTSTVGANSRLPFGGQGRSGNDWPAGVTSTLYCSYPVASVEVAEPGPPASFPGFPEP